MDSLTFFIGESGHSIFKWGLLFVHYVHSGVYIIMYVHIRTHSKGCSFEPIFLKLTRLVQVHPWVKLIVFGNNRSNKTTGIGKMCSQNWFFGFHSVWRHRTRKSGHQKLRASTTKDWLKCGQESFIDWTRQHTWRWRTTKTDTPQIGMLYGGSDDVMNGMIM